MVGELRGCDLAALAYKIKIYENLFCGSFDQIYESLHQRKFPTIRLINYNTVPSRKRAHGRCTLHWTGGWADIRSITVTVRRKRVPR